MLIFVESNKNYFLSFSDLLKNLSINLTIKVRGISTLRGKTYWGAGGKTPLPPHIYIRQK